MKNEGESGRPCVTGGFQPRDEMRSVTLTELELAMHYWQREALRTAWDLLFAQPLTGLQKRYRWLVATRRHTVDLASLPPSEQLAILLWRESLPKEE
ncbi:DUF3717 domain-containing protein [Paraburkholderia sp. J11-2]|uniref:DUF3717 domain-containing protein n=1 Tax=Paraburkholderia sp. J11-2 TaxID=2805431 RepID=UPI002AB61910|nr:DUF3717 domain-containing protein [Paraburkholderia sp. J11-2]